MSAFFTNKDSEKRIKLAFWRIKEEMGEHLDSINRNTDEIQEAFEMFERIEHKLDSIEERLERLEVAKISGEHLITLTSREEEVFALLVYGPPQIGAHEIADALSLSDDVVATILANLIAKGIPVLRQMHAGSMVVFLSGDYKSEHAKKPQVRLSERVVTSVLDEKKT
jgi:hypothetical protein